MRLRSSKEAALPFVPLSGYYFFYFSAVGVIIPFLGLYFQSLGFTAIEIAQLLAALSFARIISPPVWALLADRHGQFLYYVKLASWLSAILVLGLWWLDNYWALLVLVFGFGFFWHAALPPMESLTLSHLGKRLALYSRIRLWGSVGFIVAVLGAGILIEQWGQMAFLVTTSLFFVVTALTTMWNRESPSRATHAFDVDVLKQLLADKVVWLVLFIALMVQVAHGIYYSFYSILLTEVGYNATQIGLLWSLGVLAEIALFWVFYRLLPLLSFRSWLLVATAISVVRWLLIGFYADYVGMMIVAQLMHAATFAVFHSVVVQWLHITFEGHQAQGQALYSSISYGVGGVLGSLLAGYAWTYGGGAATFSAAALVSVIALLASLKLVR